MHDFTGQNWAFILRVILKAGLLFAAFNFAFPALPSLGQLSVYNHVVAGRERLPYGENPAESYNLSLKDLGAMFASHRISGGKAADEFRLVLIGDSSTWGFLLDNPDTLAGQINAGDYRSPDGKRIRAYNLGYPTMSLQKDLLILERAMDYQPDMLMWLFTLESFPRHTQFDSPLTLPNEESNFLGQRRAVADWLRLQVYGLMWDITRIDQAYPESYTLRQSDFEADISWKTLEFAPLPDDYLAWDLLAKGRELAGQTPLILVNEPMFISTGQNSDLRYNFFYPRWVYDAYREDLQDWGVLDFWDAIPPSEFTDSPVHLTPAGSAQLAVLLMDAIREDMK